MRRIRNSAWRLVAQWAGAAYFPAIFPLIFLASIAFTEAVGMMAPPAPGIPGGENQKNKTAPIIVRWDESQPGCTFTRSDDGKYRYGLWSGDLGIVLAVDAREVQIIRHRIEPIFGVLVSIRYRGIGSVDADPGTITLQFMKHFKVVQPALDPDDYAQKIQSDADALDDEARRTLAKHPEEKQVREARLQDYQKSVSELIEFLTKNSMRPAHLDPGNPEAGGWVFFNTDNKWIGGWKAQEEFVLRLPLDGKIFEFPFRLPPSRGEVLLRKRD
jgi:hypothetical protein